MRRQHLILPRWGLDFTAVTAGADSGITVAITLSGVDSAVTVAVSGTDITITAGSAATLQDIIDAITAHTEASCPGHGDRS